MGGICGVGCKGGLSSSLGAGPDFLSLGPEPKQFHPHSSLESPVVASGKTVQTKGDPKSEKKRFNS